MRSLRLPSLALVSLLSTGCLQFILAVGSPTQQSAAYQKVIQKAVGDAEEKKDCPRWIAGLNSIREKLPTMDSGSNATTWYGDAVMRAYHECTLVAVEDLKVGTGPELGRGTQALERFDLVLSLPLDGMTIDDRSMQTATRDYAKVPVRPGLVALKKLRAETVAEVARLETERAEKVARETMRLDAAKTAEEKGWLLASLTAWMALDPMDDATKAAKEAALARLGAQARKQLAVTVSLAPATTDGVPDALLAQLRGAAALTSIPTLEVLKPGVAATVQVRLSLGAIKKDAAKQSVSLKHVYVSGSEMVPNPQIEKLQKEIAHYDDEADKWAERARTACGNESEAGKRNCKSRTVSANNSERERQRAAKARQQLANAKPKVRKDIKSVHEYEGEKTVYTTTAPLAVQLSSSLVQVPSKRNGTAKVENFTIVYPGDSSVGLAPRTDAAPTAADLDAALIKEATRLFVDGILTAPSLVVGEFDQKAAASKEPLEKLHFAVLRALRSGADADRQSADELAKTLLKSTTDASALMRILGGGGVKASGGTP